MLPCLYAHTTTLHPSALCLDSRPLVHICCGIIHHPHQPKDTAVSMSEELSVPQTASYLGVSEETVRRNIRSKRLKAIRRGTQWFVTRQELLAFADSYDPKTGRVSWSHSGAPSQP